MKKVLILGAQGTLGQALAEEFGKNYQVLAWDRNEADVCDPAVKDKIKAVRPDIVINATGYNAVDKCETDSAEKQLAFAVNGTAPQLIAEVSKEINAIFVHYSTDYVFAGDNPAGYEEGDQPDPQSVYAQSKYEGEKNVLAVGGNFYLIRLSRLFGKPGIGQNSKKSFVDIMLGKANDAEIKVVNEERSCPTYAPDAAQFTRALIEQNQPFGIYHGNNSGACTWYEWAQEIFRIRNLRPNLIPVPANTFPRPARRPDFSELLNTKTEPQRSWQEALKDYLNKV